MALSTGERIPSLTIELFAEDGRQIHAFYAGDPRVTHMKAFYMSNPTVLAKIRPHEFSDEPGWLVTNVRAPASVHVH